MEAERDGTKKRKRAPALSLSSPYAVGRFTRRSARVNCDSIQNEQEIRCLDPSETVKRSKKSTLGDDDDGGSFNQDVVMSRMAVVDLRSRRVFSPASVTVAEADDDDDDTMIVKSFENKEQVVSDSSPDSCSISKEFEKIGEIKVMSEDVSPADDNTSVEDPNLCDRKSERGENPKLCDAKMGIDGDTALLDRVDEDSGEECVQTTPPDSNVNTHIEESLVPEKPLGIGAGSGVSKLNQTNTNQISNSTSRSKMDRAPSRLKIFQTPSSFSYRRLLPYLMGITKDDSSASSNDQCPKLEDGLKVTSSVQVLDSRKQEMSIGKSALESSLGEPCSTDGATQPIVELDASNQTSTSFESTTEGCNGKLEFSNKLDNLDAARDNSSVVIGADPPVIPLSTLGLLELQQGKPIHHFPKNAEEDNKISGLTFTRDNTLSNDGVSEIEASISSGLPGLSAKDGNDKFAISDCLDEDSGEECVQTTPPDSDIFETDLTVNEGRIEDHATLKASDGGSNSCVSEPIPDSMKQMNTSSFGNKVVLRPCSRERVFKTPNSYSYRRLLPYLKEIAKDDSVESINCQSPRDLEEKSTVTLLGSRENYDSCNVNCESLPSVTLSLNSLSPTDRDSLDKGLPDIEPSTSGLHDLSAKGMDDKRDADSIGAELDRPNGDLGEECVQSTPTDTDVSVEAEVKDNGGICEEHIRLIPSNFTSHDSVSESIVANENQIADNDDKRGADSVSAELDHPDGDLGEECVQLTPTDTNVSIEADDKVNGGLCEEQTSLIPSNGGLRGSVSKTTVASNNQISSIRSEEVRKPWSGKKVFKAPNSFSYRRLLPFLKEITEDNSYSRNCQPQKFASESEEKRTVQMLSSHSQEISIENDVPQSTLPSVVSNINVSDAASPNHTTEECLLKSKPDVSIKPCELEVAQNNASPTQESDSSIITLCPTKVADKDSKIPRLNNATDRASFGRKLSQPKKQSSFGHLNAGPVKGILKTCASYRRGCRGICTCLNCASFRLNAERAFEFSRTQLLEAEEVASGLVKELSGIRAMLENITEADNDHGVAHINQVKEACLSASKAEELAKARLIEMNNDLYCHSRMKDLQRPRVRFAQ